MNSGCDCSCDTSDFDEVKLYSQTVQKARKGYTCCECGHVIRPGDFYERVKMLCDGSWETFTTCLVCVDIRNTLCPSGWLHGGLSEQVEDGIKATGWELVRKIFIQKQRIASLVELVEELMEGRS